ncbi:MAG: response regulator [Planctomycetes bacterium]|nr:response regulator [Planctomycetota bacterium]
MKKRILIIDDDKMNVAILRKILEGEYETDVGEDGEAGLERIKEFGPDLVLLDIMMPGIDGYEVCRRIKAEPYGEMTPVILLSANVSKPDRLRGYEVGADDFLGKPFDHDELRAKVRVQFRLRAALMELAEANLKVQVHRDELEGLVEKRTREVVATRDVTVFSLAKLAESRDPETGEHLERMRSYAQILAEQLAETGPYVDQIDDRFLTDMFQSSPLHDIGKVGIPDVILLKPAQLTSSEFEIMKRHTTIGADALEEAVRHTESGGFLTMAAEIARHHHERFNGTGYPAGLYGRDIPLSARIVALADVYDALTSVRVYKSAFEPSIAQAMIEQEEGDHFDAAVIAAFRERIDDFLAVRAKKDSRCDAVKPIPVA